MFQRLDDLVVRVTEGLTFSSPVLQYNPQQNPSQHRLLITANIHGNEYTCTGVVHSLIDEIKAGSITPSCPILFVPSLNPSGMLAHTRMPSWAYTLDPNAQFNVGSEAQDGLMGAWVKDVLKLVEDFQPSLLVDLHTHSISSVAHARVPEKTHPNFDRCAELGMASGLTVVCSVGTFPNEVHKGDGMSVSMYAAISRRFGCAATLLELGPSDSVCVQSRTYGVAAIVNILDHFGLVDISKSRITSSQNVLPRVPPPSPNSLHYCSYALAPTISGLVHPLLPPGATFTKGDDLVQIRDLCGNVLETLTAPADGFVIAWRNHCIKLAGVEKTLGEFGFVQ
eukprot:c10481_g1_i1.p1 GENE.c10481_g1_i1~~c10481_g1_i1.p1  ORF type:complete len:338 (+),score=66.38 c10481_g1_i1:45-1058(+)